MKDSLIAISLGKLKKKEKGEEYLESPVKEALQEAFKALKGDDEEAFCEAMSNALRIGPDEE